jgi:hypothetical protein
VYMLPHASGSSEVGDFCMLTLNAVLTTPVRELHSASGTLYRACNGLTCVLTATC